MAQKVSNGAIGKSPGIDKINKAHGGNASSFAARKMEDLVCSHNKQIYPSIAVSFEQCKTEVRRQIAAMMEEGDEHV